MNYTNLTEAQRERACIIWVEVYNRDEDRWEDAMKDAVRGKQEDAMNDETPWWLK